MCEHHNTNHFSRATLSSVCNKHFLAHLKLLTKIPHFLDHKDWLRVDLSVDSLAVAWARRSALTK